MKRFLSFLLCVFLLGLSLPRPALAAAAWPDNVSISAEGGILIDADSGAVLYGKNIHTPYYPASITKILTALIVLEHCNLDDIVTFSHDAVYNVEAGSSSAGLDVGDQLTVRDCLYALILRSANEAANALAEHTAGSIAAFADMMNEKAASLGCTDSHFNNPSGLNDPEHYTSAYDMALISQAAFQNEAFVVIDSTLYYDLPVTRRNPEGFRVYPGHRMLKKNTSQYYPGIIGGKTGYTSLAGNTLVTCAERDGMRLITVVLNGHQTHYADTKALLDFGFANFHCAKISELDTTYASISNDMTIAGLPTTDLSILHLQENCSVTLPNTVDFSETVSGISYDLPDSAPADAIARITYSYDGRQIGAAYLIHNALGLAATEPAAEITSEAELAEAEAEAAATITGEGGTADSEAAAAVNGEGGTADSETNASDTANGAAATRTGRNIDPAADGLAAAADVAADSSGQKEGRGFHIPLPIWILLGVILLAAAGFGILILLQSHIERKETAERLARYKRREQRIQDMGMSSAEFDLLLQKRRSDSVLKQTSKPKRPKRHKSFLDDH